MTDENSATRIKEFLKRYRWIGYVILVIVAPCVAVGLFWFFGVRNVSEFSEFSTVEDAAWYGDSFGYANALFSSLALAGVVLALIIQTLEYGLAAAERRENLEIQEAISRQQFYSSLSSSIATLHDLTESGIGFSGATESHARLVLSRAEQVLLLQLVIRSMLESPDNAGHFAPELQPMAAAGLSTIRDCKRVLELARLVERTSAVLGSDTDEDTYNACMEIIQARVESTLGDIQRLLLNRLDCVLLKMEYMRFFEDISYSQELEVRRRIVDSFVNNIIRQSEKAAEAAIHARITPD